MARSNPRKVVTVACARYDGAYRLQQAYQQLWQWALNEETAVETNLNENKELSDASSSIICAGVDPPPRERSHD